MPKSKKKIQEPAYVVQSPKKDSEEAPQSTSSKPQLKSLLGEPPQALHKHSPSREPQGKEANISMRGRQMRPKSTAAPARSLMSIDFSSMGMNNSESFRSGSRNRSTHSSDEESHPDRRSEWKDVRWDQKRLETGHSRDNNKGKQMAAHAPLIVDMAHKSNLGLQPNIPQRSLLGDYWVANAQKPPSLMNLQPRDGLAPFNHPGEPYVSRNLHIPRNQGTGIVREMSAQRKRIHHSSGGSESPQKKMVKRDHSAKVHSDFTNKLIVCKGGSHSFVMIPSSCPTPYIHGRARIRVLKGNVTILAYKLEEGKDYDVYSPNSGSLLALNCSDKKKFDAKSVKDELVKYHVTDKEKELEKVGSSTIAVLMLDKLDSAACDFITSFTPYTQLFTAPMTREKDSYSLRGVSLPHMGVKIAPMKEMGPTCMLMSQDYDDVLQRFSAQISDTASGKSPPVWLCCGAKNSGKSTFCRMLVNTALQSVAAVAYLDCDVGQTEFSPPSTLSFHIIRKPILGQPFCHQRHAERMVFYGEVMSGHDPSMYMKCLQYVYKAYSEMEDKLPLIVNTMGFPEGIGLMLMVDTVQLVRPNYIVQIESHNQTINFPAITHELVALEEGWTCNRTQVTDPKMKMEETNAHELILLPTLLNQRRETFSLKPVDLRNLSLMSSLSLNMEAGLTLTTLPPYKVPYRNLAMHVCHYTLSAQDVLAAVDASVVALCVADCSKMRREDASMPQLFDEMPVCECLGLGIVRAVDVKKGLLFLVTALSRSRLQRVNTILKGCSSIPDQVILKQKTVGHDTLPYVDALAPSTGVSAVRQRARMPRLTLGGGKNR